MSVQTLWHVLKSFAPQQSGGISALPNVARLFGPTTAPWSRILESTTVATLAPAGAVTLTVDQLAGGLIVATPTANSTLTLPSAAAILAAHPRIQVNQSIRCMIRNAAPATYTVTIAAGAGGTLAATDVWVIQPGAAGAGQILTFLLSMTAIGTTPTYLCRSLGLDVA